MSVFGSIMGAIFGHGSAQASASPTAASGATLAQTAAPSAAPAQTVDVAAIVDKAAAAKAEKLAWRTSIVDLMKALNLDSSLTARKELAAVMSTQSCMGLAHQKSPLVETCAQPPRTSLKVSLIFF